MDFQNTDVAGISLSEITFKFSILIQKDINNCQGIITLNLSHCLVGRQDHSAARIANLKNDHLLRRTVEQGIIGVSSFQTIVNPVTANEQDQEDKE